MSNNITVKHERNYIIMKNREKKSDMRVVASHCSQFSPIASMQSSLSNDVCTCEICKKWDGRRCSIGLYDIIADNRDLSSEAER